MLSIYMEDVKMARTVKNGRPQSIMRTANKKLPYMVKVYEYFNNDIDQVLLGLEEFGIQYQNLYRWNTAVSTPRTKKHLENLEQISGFTQTEITMQHLQLKNA